MTAPAPPSVSDHCSPGQLKRSRAKNLAGTGAHHTESDVLSQMVIRALWTSFPEEHSEDGIARVAREYFRNKRGEPISARTVKYWLRGEVIPGGLHLATLVKMQPGIFLTGWLGRSA